MRLNHLNLAVSDVGAAKRFLQKYFELTAAPGVGDDERFCLLRDDDGMALTLSAWPKTVTTSDPLGASTAVGRSTPTLPVASPSRSWPSGRPAPTVAQARASVPHGVSQGAMAMASSGPGDDRRGSSRRRPARVVPPSP